MLFSGFLGTVENPLSDSYGDLCSGTPLNLLSNIFQLVAVVAGLYALINLIISGIQYISSNGDPKQTQAAWTRITMSFIGLVIVIGAFTVMGIVSQMLFGTAEHIFKPQIFGPGDC